MAFENLEKIFQLKKRRNKYRMSQSQGYHTREMFMSIIFSTQQSSVQHLLPFPLSSSASFSSLIT